MFGQETPNKGCSTGQGCGMLFLSNDRLKVGVDTQRGGAISWISSPKMPGEWANTNLVNTWDAGRLIQQSYYGCYDDTCWVDKPWWVPARVPRQLCTVCASWYCVLGNMLQNRLASIEAPAQCARHICVLYSNLQAAGCVAPCTFV
jgi:hypothetical protein